MEKQSKKSKIKPRKKSIDFQLKITQSKINKLNELKKISSRKSEKKKFNSQLGILKKRLKRLIKSRLIQGRKNLKKLEITKKKFGSLTLVINKDLKILNRKIRLLESQLKKLRTEKLRINHKKNFLEKSLEKIKDGITKERKIQRGLKSRKI